MSQYPREYWHAFIKTHECPSCGYKANGSLRTWLMLDGPVEAKCNKCGAQWSSAIPIGDCPERRKIESLLEDEKRYYILTKELNDLVDRPHGRNS